MFYLYTICCAAIRRNKKWMNEWIITRIIVLDWIWLCSDSCSVDCLMICMLYAAVAVTRQSFSGLALRRTCSDQIHHGEQQYRPASDRRSWSGRVDRLKAVATCACGNMYFHPRNLLGRDVSARLVSALVLPGLLQRCSCRSSNSNIGTTAGSITSYLDAVLLDCCFPTRCVTQV